MTPGEWDTRPEITAQEWDAKWCAIYDECRAEGYGDDAACDIASDVTFEQLGPRPGGWPK